MERIVVDGNDGTGKSTLVAALRALGYSVQDRGVPTRMTDDPTVEAQDGDFYIILDAPVAVSRARLEQAGKDLTERYHTVEDLTYYRQRFLEVAATLKNCVVIDSSQAPEAVLEACLAALPADARADAHNTEILK
jgi:thymidylate kinase